MTTPINNQIEAARHAGREIVVVLGLGFVGTAVVANLARTATTAGPTFFVIGVDQDTPAGREKCARLNCGEPPVYAGDASLQAVFARAHAETRNLAGAVDLDILRQADVVVACINLDLERAAGQTEVLRMQTDAYASLMRAVGARIPPNTLVTVESTLPLGLCDTVLYPALCDGLRAQGIDSTQHPPLLAFCYERVMPGPDYLNSVNNYWRAFGGINAASSQRAREFLSKFVNVAQYPLWEHKHTRAAEMAKLLENSYRATNIAFIEEWAKLAEAAGIDLFDIVASVRVRKGTHDNMMLPGLGVGGYCLTKDALLAAYGAEHVLHVPAELPFSRRAILTNERMPIRAVDWIRAHFGGSCPGKRVALLGLTYRPQVADTRSSASEVVARELLAEGVIVSAYDPLLTTWDEVPGVALHADPRAAVSGAAAVIICLPDRAYRSFLADVLTQELSGGAIVVDPWNLVGDDLAAALTARGITVRVYGRGDMPQQGRSA